jgi:hypothetical protein
MAVCLSSPHVMVTVLSSGRTVVADNEPSPLRFGSLMREAAER